MPGPAQTGNAGTPTTAEVRRSLERILATDAFVAAPQLRLFLTFVVEETLAGKTERIKAYTIATQALGRGDDFDAQSSPVVRVAAGRLRQALAADGQREDAAADPVIITLPTGTYVPSFSYRQDAGADPANPDPDPDGALRPLAGTMDRAGRDAAVLSRTLTGEPEMSRPPMVRARPSGTRVVGIAALCLLVAGAGLAWWQWSDDATTGTTAALSGTDLERARRTGSLQDPAAADVPRMPVVDGTILLTAQRYPDWFAADQLEAAMNLTLARFGDYRFTSARVVRGQAGARRTVVAGDYHLRLTAAPAGGSVRLYASLSRVSDDTILWSGQHSFAGPAGDGTVDDLADAMGRALSPVFSPYGVVYSDILRVGAPRLALECLMRGYRYFHRESDNRHVVARRCAEAQIEAGSRLPAIHAMLAFLYLDEYRESRNLRPRDPLKAAMAMARRAVELGPQSARAHQALFAVHKVQNNQSEARQAGRRAVSLNPYDSDVMADYAAWLIARGDWREGRRVLDRAAALLDAQPAWVEFYRFLGAELAGEFDTADQVSRMMDMRRSPLLAMAVAIGAQRRGEGDERDRALHELVERDPRFASDPEGVLRRRGFEEGVVRRLVSALEQAGLDKVARPAGSPAD